MYKSDQKAPIQTVLDRCHFYPIDIYVFWQAINHQSRNFQSKMFTKIQFVFSFVCAGYFSIGNLNPAYFWIFLENILTALTLQQGTSRIDSDLVTCAPSTCICVGVCGMAEQIIYALTTANWPNTYPAEVLSCRFFIINKIKWDRKRFSVILRLHWFNDFISL